MGVLREEFPKFVGAVLEDFGAMMEPLFIFRKEDAGGFTPLPFELFQTQRRYRHQCFCPGVFDLPAADPVGQRYHVVHRPAQRVTGRERTRSAFRQDGQGILRPGHFVNQVTLDVGNIQRRTSRRIRPAFCGSFQLWGIRHFIGWLGLSRQRIGWPQRSVKISA